MQYKVTMDTCYRFLVSFSSYQIADAFVLELAERDDVWLVKKEGRDIRFTTTSSAALKRFAQDFERQWLEKAIAAASASIEETLSVKSDPQPVKVDPQPSAVPLAAVVPLDKEIELPEAEKDEDEDFEPSED